MEIIIALIIYILPMCIAFQRHHKNVAAISIVNLLLGWTFIGWVVALAWSVTNAN